MRAARCVPWATALAHLILGANVLYRAHPSEDAYILFDYVKNLVAGHGIVYWPGGPHAEGATDFLWMLAIAALVRLGCDVAVAAVLGNSAGAWMASRIAIGAILRAGVRGPAALALSLATFVFACGAAALASYVGFSATAYSALALLLFVWWTDAPPGKLHWILWIGLATALFRPDGAFLAAGFAALGFARARQESTLPKYLRTAGLVALAGAVYALGRWLYFGLLLPLPLYVKGHAAGELPGIEPTLGWLGDRLGAAPLALGIGAVFAAGLALRSKIAGDAGRLLLGFLPFLAHAVALCFAHQSQNFAFRFHAPTGAALIYLLLVLAARACAAARSPVLRAAICAATLACFVPGFRRTLELYPWTWRQHTYVDSFAPELGRILEPGRTIALTEAGRLAYWTSVRVEDIVGLNNPRTARAPADLAYLRSIDPDVVMFYSSPAVFGFARALPGAKIAPVAPLDLELLRDVPDPLYRQVFDRDVDQWVEGVIPGRVASLKLARFLVESRAYDAYAVRYAAGYEHVWALRRGLPEAPRILEALRAAARDEDYRTYAEAAGLPFAQFARP